MSQIITTVSEFCGGEDVFRNRILFLLQASGIPSTHLFNTKLAKHHSWGGDFCVGGGCENRYAEDGGGNIAANDSVVPTAKSGD